MDTFDAYVDDIEEEQRNVIRRRENELRTGIRRPAEMIMAGTKSGRMYSKKPSFVEINRGITKITATEIVDDIEDGKPCDHPGCLNHVTHACEGCGRNQGRRSALVHDYEGDFTALEVRSLQLMELDTVVLACAGGQSVQPITPELLKALNEHDIPFEVMEQDDMFNLSFVERKAQSAMEMVYQVCKPTIPTKGALITGRGDTFRPQPKHINARQAWKNRGKTRRK